jgi:predicted nuclease with RNAse H fold
VEITVVGIDCAVNPKNVGLALGVFRSDRVEVEEVTAGRTEPSIAAIIEAWLGRRPGSPALLALDAPLGWPETMGTELSGHRAGAPLQTAPNELFRRQTDRFIKEKIKITPLTIGADKIARTAHAALQMLKLLRKILGQPIPLASARPDAVSAIEVYPAATRAAHGIPVKARKDESKAARASRIVEKLSPHLLFPESIEARAMFTLDEADALTCLLAAQDFLLGHAMEPPPGTPVSQEGWIWVRERIDAVA